MKTTTFLLSLLLLSAPAFAASPIEVTLQFASATILPGVPFDAVITIRNVSNHPVTVGAKGALIVKRGDAAAVRTEPSFRVQRESLVQNPLNFELEGGESIRGFIPWSSNWFFKDQELSGPGTYDFAIELSMIQDDVENYAGDVTSADARLTRVTPTGEDAVVWKRLQEATDGHWPSHGFGSSVTRTNLAAEVITQHPSSSYYPYALMMNGVAPELPIDVARDLVKRFPDSPAYPHILVHAGVAAYNKARELQRKGEEPLAMDAYFREAVDYHRAAVATGDAVIKAVARDGATNAQKEWERIGRPKAK